MEKAVSASPISDATSIRARSISTARGDSSVTSPRDWARASAAVTSAPVRSARRPLDSRSAGRVFGVAHGHGQLGSQLAPVAGQAGVDLLNGVPGPSGEVGAQVGGESGEHGVTGQGVPEPVAAGVAGHELDGGAALQHLQDLGRRAVEHPADQRSVGPAAEQRRRSRNVAVRRIEPSDAALDRRGEGAGYGRVGLVQRPVRTVGTSPPVPTASASRSSTRNGTPSARSSISPMPSGRAGVRRQARAISATSGTDGQRAQLHR